jgi:tetratricopeptide (TPR) repeat protein
VRTGPFSDPAVVNIINRYFVAYHMDNTKWTEPRYGFKPGQEDAYIMMETPEAAGVEKDLVILNRLSVVLDAKKARLELLAFLDKHKDLYHPLPEMVRLESDDSHQSRLRRAELLLDEGRSAEALALLDRPDSPLAATALLTARAYRLEGKYAEAAAALDRLGDDAPDKFAEDAKMERIRIAFEQGRNEEAAALLDKFMDRSVPPALGAEAQFLRGWLHHRAGNAERAIDVWSQGIDRYPPSKALYSQKAYFTMIRLNWDLPDNVDQVY